MAITPLKSSEISARDIKEKLNEIIGVLNGDDAAASKALAAAVLNDLPTANVASPDFYLNAGVVTKGSL